MDTSRYVTIPQLPGTNQRKPGAGGSTTETQATESVAEIGATVVFGKLLKLPL